MKSANLHACNSNHRRVLRLIAQVLSATALWIINTPAVKGETVFPDGFIQRLGPGNLAVGYDATYVVPNGTAAMYGAGSTIYATNDFIVRGGGTLIIDDFNILVGGNFITEIASLTLGGNVYVAGTASLSGVLGFAIDQAPEPNARYTILTAGEGIIGRFSRLETPYVRQPGSLLAYDIKYESNAVIVETVQNEFRNALSVFTLTGNQNATAGALDSAISDPRQDAVHSYLNAKGIHAIPGLLDQIAPEELGAIYSIGSARMNSAVNSLQNRFAEIRSSPESAFTVVKVASSISSDAKSAADAPVLAPPSRQRHGVFTTVSGDFSSSGDTGNANGYDTDAGTILAGFDALINHSLTVGVLVGYSHSNSDLYDGGDIDADGCNAALYAQYVSNDWFLESMIGGGYNSYQTDRAALNGTARGDTDGGELNGYVSFGKDLRYGTLTVTPFASLLYTRTSVEEYEESGSLQPLRIESQAADSLRSRLGLRAMKTFVQDGFRITPYASAEWQYELLDDAAAVNYSFANGAGATATATGPEIGQHSLLSTVGLQVAWGRHTCYLSYQADIGRDNHENQMVLTGFRMSW